MKILQNVFAFLWNSPTANNANSYLINGSKKVLIDPGHHHLFSHVKVGLQRLSLTPEDLDLVIITHGHPDHIEAAKAFLHSSTIIALHHLELEFIRDIAPHYGSSLGPSRFEPRLLLKEGDLRIGDMDFTVILTPGHSPGSLCLYWPQEEVLFTGDVVFNQGLGRTDLPGGDGNALKESIRRISRLQVKYLLPGHGDILAGRELVEKNFRGIEEFWFAYI